MAREVASRLYAYITQYDWLHRITTGKDLLNTAASIVGDCAPSLRVNVFSPYLVPMVLCSGSGEQPNLRTHISRIFGLRLVIGPYARSPID